MVNAGRIGGIESTFDAELDVGDGLLDVFMIKTSIFTVRSVTGRFLRLPTHQAGLRDWHSREIVPEADSPQTMLVDGGWLGIIPLTDTTVPAVQTVVP